MHIYIYIYTHIYIYIYEMRARPEAGPKRRLPLVAKGAVRQLPTHSESKVQQLLAISESKVRLPNGGLLVRQLPTRSESKAFEARVSHDETRVRVASGIPVSVKKHSFYASPCPAVLRQTLQSSP